MIKLNNMLFKSSGNLYSLNLLELDKFFLIAPFTWSFIIEGFKANETFLENDSEPTNPSLLIYLLIMFLSTFLSRLVKSINITLIVLNNVQSFLLEISVYLVVVLLMHIIYKFMDYKNNINNKHGKKVLIRFIPNNEYYLHCLWYCLFNCFFFLLIFKMYKSLSYIYFILSIFFFIMLYIIQHNHWYHYIRCNCEIVVKENEK